VRHLSLLRTGDDVGLWTSIQLDGSDHPMVSYYDATHTALKFASFDGSMPTGVTVAPNGRIFVNFPRWGDPVPDTVAEIRDGKPVAYPDDAINKLDAARPKDTFVSVQSVVADSKNRLWILDTGSVKFAPVVAGGAKLVAVDLATDKVVKTIVLAATSVLKTTYINDVRFDLRKGKAGFAYITDSSVSGPGAIIVVDLDSGESWRKLNGHASTSADPAFVPVVEGETLAIRETGKPPVPFAVASDGIALALWLIVQARGGVRTGRGSWLSAAALLTYALGFSFAFGGDIGASNIMNANPCTAKAAAKPSVRRQLKRSSCSWYASNAISLNRCESVITPPHVRGPTARLFGMNPKR